MSMKFADKINKIICGDTLTELRKFPDECISMVLTSPPYYGLRDYGIDGQLGLEKTPELYMQKMREIMLEIKRVLRADGTIWWNVGDTYGGGVAHSDFTNVKRYTEGGDWKREPFKSNVVKPMPKCLLLMPERFAFMMLDIGFTLRNKIIWHKPNPMPSSVKDRFTTTWEYVYLFSKSKKYFFDLDAVRKKYDKPMNRWGGQKLKAKGQAAKDLQGLYRDRDMRPNPLGKNPGDVFTVRKQPSSPHGLKRWERGKNVWEERFHELGKNPGDFWSITTQPFKGAHFAVFPEKLCVTPIKAGCPKEICNKCGKPRVRIVELGKLVSSSPDIPMAIKPRAFTQNKLIKQELPKDPWGSLPRRERKTIGFTDCGCNAGFSPGIVLDPFAGAGTACLVAKKLGRNYIGIDLKPEYCEMARARLAKIPKRLDKFV